MSAIEELTDWTCDIPYCHEMEEMNHPEGSREAQINRLLIRAATREAMALIDIGEEVKRRQN